MLQRFGMAEAVAWTLVRNVETLGALAESYGFRSYAFWQPCLTVADTSNALSYLAGVLDHEQGFRWIDNQGHVTPEANRLIADAMLRIIRE